MSKRKISELSPQELDKLLAEDVLSEAYPCDEVDEELRALDGDPEEIGGRVAQLVASLAKEGSATDSSASADDNGTLLKAALHGGAVSRQELMDRIRQARHPKLLEALKGLKDLEDASDDELQETLERIELLRRVMGREDK